MLELIIILVLIVINGLLATAEIAIVSSRKSRLQKEAEEGGRRAKVALSLIENPNRSLSTIQVGITLVGILVGIFSGASIAAAIQVYLEKIPFVAGYSRFLSVAAVVILTTYLTIVLGELVPKRVAMSRPETMAKWLSIPMSVLSKIASPIVEVLSFSTELILKIFRIRKEESNGVTEEEVNYLIREGAEAGVFEKAEQDIVERTLRVGDQAVIDLMTLPKEIVWIDIADSAKEIKKIINHNLYSYYPVKEDSAENIVGVIKTEELLRHMILDRRFNIQNYIHTPLYVPESMSALKVLEKFKQTGIHIAMIVDEYGSLEGLVSVTDILEAIVGDIPTIGAAEEEDIIKRDDHSYLVDGLVPIDEFKDYFHLKKLPDEDNAAYHTIGGFMMHRLEHIPKPGEKVETNNLKLEVMDMDGNRVDKVLVMPVNS